MFKKNVDVKCLRFFLGPDPTEGDPDEEGSIYGGSIYNGSIYEVPISPSSVNTTIARSPVLPAISEDDRHSESFIPQTQIVSPETPILTPISRNVLQGHPDNSINRYPQYNPPDQISLHGPEFYPGDTFSDSAGSQNTMFKVSGVLKMKDGTAKEVEGILNVGQGEGPPIHAQNISFRSCRTLEVRGKPDVVPVHSGSNLSSRRGSGSLIPEDEEIVQKVRKALKRVSVKNEDEIYADNTSSSTENIPLQLLKPRSTNTISRTENNLQMKKQTSDVSAIFNRQAHRALSSTVENRPRISIRQENSAPEVGIPITGLNKVAYNEPYDHMMTRDSGTSSMTASSSSEQLYGNRYMVKLAENLHIRSKYNSNLFSDSS